MMKSVHFHIGVSCSIRFSFQTLKMRFARFFNELYSGVLKVDQWS